MKRDVVCQTPDPKRNCRAWRHGPAWPSLSIRILAAKTAFNGFGCGLGGPAGEHHEHQLGGSVGLTTTDPPMAHRPPQLMLMMLARRAPKSTPEAIKNSVLNDKHRRNKACWEHTKTSIFTAFSPLSKAIKKGVTEIATRNAVVPVLSLEAVPMGTQNRQKNQDRRAMKRVGGMGASPGKLKL